MPTSRLGTEEGGLSGPGPQNAHNLMVETCWQQHKEEVISDVRVEHTR